MNKIYAFEVRGDEQKYLDDLSKKHHVEIVCSPEVLTLEKIDALDQDSGVTILGMGHYGEKEMAELKERSIHYLSTRTIGYNHIDLEAAKRHDVHVCNASYAPNGVADYTVMMILLCLRNYKQALWRMQVNDFSLSGLAGREMKDLTIGVIGTGHIGTQVIKDLSGFGCSLICYDRHKNDEAASLGTYVSLDELYARSDVITIHLALNSETNHIINEESIAKMKDGVVLINCARGGLMDIHALIKGVEQEKIGALGLDTVEEEEGIVHRDLKTAIFADRDIAYLRQFKNVVYTYHMAFYTDEAVRSMAECGIEGLLEMANDVECKTQLC